MAVINLKVCTGKRQVVYVEKEKAFFVAFILYAFHVISKKIYIYISSSGKPKLIYFPVPNTFYCSFPAQNHTRTVQNLAAAHYLPGMLPLDIVICP